MGGMGGMGGMPGMGAGAPRGGAASAGAHDPNIVNITSGKRSLDPTH
jgi:hypothetical protein